MSVMNYRKAIAEAIARAMRRDSSVIFLGEDVGAAGGAFKTTVGLLEEFGPGRVWDTPISEQAIIGAAIGASMRGLRPIAEIMFADFLGTCWDGVVNHAAKLRYMTDGQLCAPMVIRTHGGAGLGFGAQHSQLFDSAAMSVPGLKVVMPSNPIDLIGMFQAAVDDPDPVLFIEHKALFDVKQEVPDDHYSVPLGEARRVLSGDDATLVTIGAMVPVSVRAAKTCAENGAVSLDVIDLRSLTPLDMATVFESVSRTSRLLIVEEGAGICGWGSEVAARVADEAFWKLDAPIRRVTSPPVPTPFAGVLEDAWLPTSERIVSEIESFR
jgi:acetoin:2,6-dichlorophenolindophenol oxidoreductase subunit beta